MNALRYLLPIAIVIFGLLFFRSRQASENSAPSPALAAKENQAEAKRLLGGLNEVLAQATKILGSVQDSSSVDAAVSQLQALGPSLETALAVWQQVPESVRPKFQPVVARGEAKLKAAIDTTLALPGVSEKLKPATDQLLAKLKAFE